MRSSKLKVFSDISYLALNQMENQSDDERETVPEVREDAATDDDEFSTYFTDQKVEIPEDDRVRN